ncbi:ABC transporter permease [Candidatus Woesebacteria bacterium]|nr:ABC transporter permease [Candidatus Woesebacteria bacterium]
MRLMQEVFPVIKIVINPLNWFHFIKNSIVNFPHTLRKLYSFIIFFIILIFFMVAKAYSLLMRIPLLGIFFRRIKPLFLPVTKTAEKIVAYLEKIRPFQVRQSYLVNIAFGNLRARANRTLVTIFGMAAGIGIIVYLLSLGYGIERLVVSQVASLDELRIIDVAASQNTALKLDRQTLKKIKAMPKVKEVVPLISLVGRVSFNKAQTDVLVYAADEKFLEVSSIQLKKGKLFTDAGNAQDMLGQGLQKENGDVAGAENEVLPGVENTARENRLTSFNMLPDRAVPVWESCSISAKLLGYTTRLDASIQGTKMWGSTYAPYANGGRTGYDKKEGDYLGNWVGAKLPLFTEGEGETLRPLLSRGGYQMWGQGCIQEMHVQFDQQQLYVGSVLGTSTSASKSASATAAAIGEVLASSSSAKLDAALAAQGVEATGSATPAFDTEVISTDSAGIEYVRLIASEEAKLASKNAKIPFSKEPIAQAVITTGLMKLLNIKESDVLDKSFAVSFIISESLRPDVKGRQLSEEKRYQIIGLVDDDDNQYFYVPFTDMQQLGVQNFSQLKVIMEDEAAVQDVRKKIETLGYNTTSVGDTVAQIESLFASLRLALGAIGLIALAVASLGMFNTLTVSLLERTREIGGMKVIGMVSEEIQDLFLAEAMIMGFSGGIGGLMLGFAFGQITSVIVSVLSVTQGLGYLNLTYIPIPFTITILILSFIVGIVTGLYPAKRARSISALNALRYE